MKHLEDYSAREKALNAVKKTGNSLRQLEECFRDDIEIVLVAMESSYWIAFAHASERIRSDKNIVIKYLNEAVLPSLEYIHKSLHDDAEIATLAVQRSSESLLFLSEKFRNNRDIVIMAVQAYGEALEYVNTTFQNDFDVVHIAVQKNGKALKYASEALKNNSTIVQSAVTSHGKALYYANESFRDNREIVLLAVRHRGVVLKIVSKKLRADKEIVLLAVSEFNNRFQKTSALYYAHKSLKCNKDIAMAALKNNKKAYKHICAALKNDADILKMSDG